jgi:hypothetical protein
MHVGGWVENERLKQFESRWIEYLRSFKTTYIRNPNANDKQVIGHDNPPRAANSIASYTMNGVQLKYLQ